MKLFNFLVLYRYKTKNRMICKTKYHFSFFCFCFSCFFFFSFLFSLYSLKTHGGHLFCSQSDYSSPMQGTAPTLELTQPDILQWPADHRSNVWFLVPPMYGPLCSDACSAIFDLPTNDKMLHGPLISFITILLWCLAI